MTLAELRAAIIADLQTRLGDSVKVAGHGGRFGADELKRYGAVAPACLVALLGVSNLHPSGAGIDGDVACAALVVTGDRPGLPRDLAALGIVTTLAAHLPGESFGLDVTGAVAVRADNLYSGEVDKVGMALWALTWRQTDVTLSALAAGDLSDFLHLHSGFDSNADAAADLSDDLLLGPPAGFVYLLADGQPVRAADGSFVYVPEGD